jgi:maltooligosyltrehalose trehalohydrolase
MNLPNRCVSEIWVWAPNASEVELVTPQGRQPLERGEGGVFLGPVLSPGTDYFFSLDGGPPLPDPRSRFQPHGVHGPSRVIEPAFEFTDGGFRAPPVSSGVLYELHVGTFAPNGTFDGVIERLPHLVDLGVTHVEFMPIAEFPGRHGWGYDSVGLFAAHSAYGGPVAFKRLVNACHAHGLGVILDVVYNHFGPDGNYLPKFGPYLTETFHTPWGAAVNLDGPSSSAVRRHFIDNALDWFEHFHVDALRLDAVHAFFDRSALHFLRQLADETAELSERLRKPLALIGESDLNDPRIIRPREALGYGLDAQWSDDFHHALHVTLTGERNGISSDFAGLSDLARALERGFVYDGGYSAFRGRAHGLPLGDTSLRRLVVAMQNHDQIGNRALGERISHLVSPRRAELGAVLTLLGPSVPMLFQGEEWAASSPFLYFTDHHEPELARAVREGRKHEFAAYGWPEDAVPDPQAPETFGKSKLNFSELEQPLHASVLATYKALIRLRQRPELTSTRVRVKADEKRGTLILEREHSRVCVNFGAEPVHLPLHLGEEFVFSSGGATQDRELVLPSESAAVLVKRLDSSGRSPSIADATSAR